MEALLILLIKGIIVGFLIAAPVGAIGILCIRRTLVGDYFLGVSTGLGAGFADICYASIAAFGLASISEFLISHEFWLKLIGGAALVWVGARVYKTCPIKEKEASNHEYSYVHSFVSAFFLTLTNPITILAFVAVFAAMGVDHLDDSWHQPLVLILGVAIGACGWWISLCTGMTLMRHKISENSLIWINRASGALLIAFAIGILASIGFSNKQEGSPMESAQILQFWFGHPEDSDYGQFRSWWFEKSQDTDDRIKERYMTLHSEIMDDKHRHILSSPEGYLAQILVLDQFSRNMYRDSPKAFESDAKALSLAKEAISKGYDVQLPEFMRSFLYLPFEHSEILEDQNQSVALFEKLGDPLNLEYAIKHKVIIERFGRFPHRNSILGRASTYEEIEFLKGPDSSF